MATLDRIKICGIRSFGCEEEDVQTVRFQKPLTLILGENGCGKSTIIECLRYLTAQKEPSGKGTFVHDPKLTNRATVKGFVKLRMKDGKGEIVHLCRQVQATRTSKSLTTKSLDNVITRTKKDDKEKVSLSNRCADFTYEISRIFGVSRAILENVVFCTQEDSHWPLDTDQKLKEKFDQIFDSDKYNKCVNKVREKRKKIKDVVKNVEIELKYLKDNKTMAAEKRRRLEKTKIQVNSCNEKIQELNSNLEVVENQLKDIYEKELHVTQNQTKKDMKKAELKNLEQQLLELKSQINNQFPGTDEELKKEIEDFHNLLVERQKEIVTLEKNIEKHTSEELKLSKDLMKEQGMLGQLLKEEEMNEERVSERNQQLKNLAADLNINVSTQMSSEESVQNLIKNVKAKVMDEEDELTKTKQMLEEEEQDMQNNIDKIREQSLIAQNEVSNKEKSLSNCQKEKSKIQKEINEMDQSQSNFAKLEASLSKVNKELKELQGSVNPEELKENVKKSVEERNKLEERLVEIEKEVQTLQQKSGISAQLDLQNDLKSNKDSQFRRLKNKHEDSLKALLGEMPETGFKAAIQNHIDSARQKVKELTALRSTKEKELTEAEMRRKHLKEKLRAKEELLRGNEEELYDICGGNDYEDTVNLVRRQVEDLQDIKGTLSFSDFMYKRYIKALEKTEPCCPLCHRDFKEETEARSLIDELNGKLREVPTKLAENKNQLEEKQMKYNRLLSLRSKFDQISVLKNNEIPELRSEMEKTEKTLKNVQKELSDLESSLYSPQADEAVCISLQDDMVLLDQLVSERKQISKQIEKLQAELGDSGGDKNKLKKSMDEQDSVRQKIKVVRQRVEEFQSKLSSFNEQLQNKQSMKNSLMEQINKIQGSSGQKKNLSEKLQELEVEETTIKAELEAAKKKLESLKKHLQEVIKNKNLEKTKNSERLERLSHKINGYTKQLHDIENQNKMIRTHNDKGIDERIEAVQNVMSQIENKIKSLKSEKDEAAKKINNYKKSLSNQELRERELNDNMRFRQKTKEAKILRSEVAELEEKYGNTDFQALLTEKRKLKEKEEEIGKNKAQIQGRMVEMESQLKLLEKELLSKTFRTIDDDYNKEFLKSEVLKAIGKDLERYAITMEYAMMTYHKQQMTKVNAFIREYWRKIYQGNDIDYIEILTDNIESTEKRRNYNYKVVQVKSDVYLDMRNRCSAGQKMLASLIIRLALAETFSSNCGILTLDEPTTNLDRKNIKNLARTLNEVLTAKQNTLNPNFQLIVITHDEEFLQELMELDIVSEYVKVDRNPRGKTVVSSRVFSGSELNLVRPNKYSQRQQYDYD